MLSRISQHAVSERAYLFSVRNVLCCRVFFSVLAFDREILGSDDGSHGSTCVVALVSPLVPDQAKAGTLLKSFLR
jgi:hypothetical protein